jgi:hypothetical protein
MENEQEFVGTALATTFLLRLVITLLFRKGTLSRNECVDLFDAAQLLLEEQQSIDVPANERIWQAGRRYLEHLAEHPICAEGVRVKQEIDNE